MTRACSSEMLAVSHRIHDTGVAAVVTVVESISNRGVQFVTVTELFGPSGLVPGRVYGRGGAPR